MGIAVHEALTNWEIDKGFDPLDYFLVTYDSLVDEAWEKQPDGRLWIIPPPSKKVLPAIEKYRDRGYEQIQTYIDRFQYANYYTYGVEIEFEIQLADVTVKGAIDHLLRYNDSGQWMIQDMKTGSPKSEDDFRQLALYAYVARSQLDVPVTEGRYWFTKLDRGSEVFNLGKFDKDYWVEQFKLLDKAISQNIFLPNPGENCGLCGVQPWCRSQGFLEIGEPLYEG